MNALTHPSLAVLPLAESWLVEAYDSINSAIGTQQGMVLFGCAGMIVALYVIWHRR